MQEYLEFQLRVATCDDGDISIGFYLIGDIDDNGYLCSTVDELANQLGVNEKQVDAVLKKIQTFDSAGVGAHDIREPGRSFYGTNSTCYITSDITIRLINGTYVIIMNDSNLPQLRINASYHRMLQDGDDETKTFIKDRLNTAIFLIKSIERRRSTIYKVVEAIVALQRF